MVIIMEFRKYNSITNHFEKSSLGKWLKMYPELYNEQYIIQEKIHGSNFSIWFENNNEEVNIKYANRTSFLDITDRFFDYQLALQNEKVEKLINNIVNKIKKDNIKELVIFGELYGGRIQKGVYYSDQKHIKFFDMRIDDVYLPFKETEEFFKEMESEDLLVPKIAIVNSLDEALEFVPEFNTLLSDKEFEGLDNICEGIVIKTYNKVFTNKDGSFFYIKNKNEKYWEKHKLKRPNQKDYTMCDTANELRDIFQTYITENRLYSVFSKYGQIESVKEIGKYISLLTEDARQDFMKEYKEKFDPLTDREKRNILKVSDIASKIVRSNM